MESFFPRWRSINIDASSTLVYAYHANLREFYEEKLKPTPWEIPSTSYVNNQFITICGMVWRSDTFGTILSSSLPRKTFHRSVVLCFFFFPSPFLMWKKQVHLTFNVSFYSAMLGSFIHIYQCQKQRSPRERTPTRKLGGFFKSFFYPRRVCVLLKWRNSLRTFSFPHTFLAKLGEFQTEVR